MGAPASSIYQECIALTVSYVNCMFRPCTLEINQSGNVGTLADGSPIIYDPSSYFGHNEAE